jgi:hypothetical protein
MEGNTCVAETQLSASSVDYRCGDDGEEYD